MAIAFQCEHCGKKVEAPDSAGGKRGRCPYCHQSCYIPSPVSEEDLYELALEDEAEEPRARQQPLSRQEEELIAEIGGQPVAPVPLEHRQDLKSEDLHHFVVNYCLDMAASKLQRADTYVQKLQDFGPLGVAAVEDFLTGRALEPALDQIPTKVLQGFLNQLRQALG